MLYVPCNTCADHAEGNSKSHKCPTSAKISTNPLVYESSRPAIAVSKKLLKWFSYVDLPILVKIQIPLGALRSGSPFLTAQQLHVSFSLVCLVCLVCFTSCKRYSNLAQAGVLDAPLLDDLEAAVVEMNDRLQYRMDILGRRHSFACRV